MLLIARASEKLKFSDAFDQMYRLRARQFSQRRGWRVNVDNGLETDIFDTMDPLYICLLDEHQKLLASLRLLPTTGAHMLSDVFPEVMGDAGIIRQPLVWESSRFCVDTEAVRVFGEDGINVVTRSILAGLFDTAFEAGMENIISVYDVFVERILRRAGCMFDRLGPIVKYDGLKTVAGLFEVSREVVAALRNGDERIIALHAA